MLNEQLKEQLKTLSYEDIKEAVGIMLSSVTETSNWDRKLRAAEKRDIDTYSADTKKDELYKSLLKTSLLNNLKGEIDKAVKYDDDKVKYLYDKYMEDDASVSEKEHNRIVSDTFIAREVRVAKKVFNQDQFLRRLQEPKVQTCIIDALKDGNLTFTAYSKFVSAVNLEARNNNFIDEGEQLVTGEEMSTTGFTSTKELCPLYAYEGDEAEEEY